MLAGILHPLDRHHKLPHDVRPFRIAEVQTVRQPDRLRAGAGQIPRRFRHRQPRPFVGIEQTVPAVAIHRHRHRFVRALDAHHRGVRPRPHHRIRPHHVVVLLIDPAFARDRRRFQERQQGRIRILHIGQHVVVQIREHVLIAGRRIGTLIARSVIGQRLCRNLRDNFALIEHTKDAAPRHLPDHSYIQIPLLADPDALLFLASLRHHQHTFLRLGQHELIGRHARFAARHMRQIEIDAVPGPRRHFAGRTRQACRPHVLNADQEIVRHQFETGLQQEFFLERIADLNGRPLLFGLVIKGVGRHRRAVNPVAPRL